MSNYSESSEDMENIGLPLVQDVEATGKQINPKIKNIIKELLKKPEGYYEDGMTLKKELLRLQRIYKYGPSKLELLTTYKQMMKENPEEYIKNDSLLRVLIVKAIRSESGIVNISVSTPPDKFSCKYNCYFCPNEPGMPRSYLSNEDVFRRASAVGFDTAKQVWSRLDVLNTNGHPIDKLEFRVLGGTFSCYDHTVADEYIRDLYFAANTYFSSGNEEGKGRNRVRGTIEEEQAINVYTKPHVVGLGVETRPDEIKESEIIRFRRYGVTRVELGVQHTDDLLLRGVNRGHGIKQSKRAIKLLKDYGFKLELHIMADLPGATPEGDKDCYRQVLRDDPDLIPDYMKDYPCLDVSFTKVKEWKESGKWKPYSERTPDARDLKDVLIYRQSITPKWVRVNRIQRDFRPATCGQLGYTSPSIKNNLAQIVKDEAEKQGIYCQCIRCCEVRGQKFTADEVEYCVETFEASGGREYFISAEVQRPNRNLMLGFVRLRISDALHESIIPELTGNTAMVRELHVYGKVQEVGSTTDKDAAQHLGLGKKLLQMAEVIARKDHGCEKIGIIAGVGVRHYYKKRGYELQGTYMIKGLVSEFDFTREDFIVAAVIFVCLLIMGQCMFDIFSEL
jgi:ELP3 family radical SAM enzyme/protein acetyltransferase